jgi:hypothetical protein
MEICREEEALFSGTDRGVLKQAEVGVPTAELIRQVGIAEQTLYRIAGRSSTRGWRPTRSGSSDNSKRRMAG